MLMEESLRENGISVTVMMEAVRPEGNERKRTGEGKEMGQ